MGSSLRQGPRGRGPASRPALGHPRPSPRWGGLSLAAGSRPLLGFPIRAQLGGLGPRPPQDRSLPLQHLFGLFHTHHHLRPPASLCRGPGGHQAGVAHGVCTAHASDLGASEAPSVSLPGGQSAPWWLFNHCHPQAGGTCYTDAGGGRMGLVAQKGPPAAGPDGQQVARFTSPRRSGPHSGRLNPSGPAGRGGGAALEVSFGGWEGCWLQKWLGLLRATCPNMRPCSPVLPLGPSPGACPRGCFVSHTNLSAKAACGPLPSQPQRAHLPRRAAHYRADCTAAGLRSQRTPGTARPPDPSAEWPVSRPSLRAQAGGPGGGSGAHLGGISRPHPAQGARAVKPHGINFEWPPDRRRENSGDTHGPGNPGRSAG